MKNCPRMKSWLFRALFVLMLPGAANGAVSCPVPEEFQLHDLALPATAGAIAGQKPVRIVAFGASSTAGAAAGDPLQTYPARLQARLAAIFPKAAIEVVNAGASREDASQMLRRLDRDVLARQPALVIWEVGTNDAARGRDIDSFAGDLANGIERLRAAQADVILMDMQYAPSTASIINFDPYLDVLRQIADLNDVAVFRRYDIMRAWGEAGVFAYDVTGAQKQTATARAVYDCLAAGLAGGIAAAVK